MAEISRFWDGTALGDAVLAPYDSFTEFSQTLGNISGGDGVLKGINNELIVTDTGGGNVQAASGRSLVYGTWHDNSAAITFAISTPITFTRVDLIVVRKSWATQTVRVVKVTGVEGAGVPALTQISGTTWEIRLAEISITIGGVITITDRRAFLSAIISSRQGGNATNWSVPGTTNYSPYRTRFEAGVVDLVIGNGNVSGTVTITFPIPFDNIPFVIGTPFYGAPATGETVPFVALTTTSITQAIFYATRGNYASTVGAQTIRVHWTAMGPIFDV